MITPHDPTMVPPVMQLHSEQLIEAVRKNDMSKVGQILELGKFLHPCFQSKLTTRDELASRVRR